MTRGISDRFGSGDRCRRSDIFSGSPFSDLMMDYLDDLFARLGINCVLDIGAREGDFALSLRKAGYRGHIISFEPVYQSYRILERRTKRDPRWNCHKIALGSANSLGDMNVTGDTHFCSFLTPNHYCLRQFGRAAAVQRVEHVSIRRLDSIFDEVVPDPATARVYLKIDTQGWDNKVLRGAARCAKILALQCEMAVQPIYSGVPRMSQSIELLSRLGFVPSAFFPVNHDSAMRLIEVDCVAIRVRRRRNGT